MPDVTAGRAPFTTIALTVGRVMWYWPNGPVIACLNAPINPAQPFIAHVCFVHSPAIVNALVIDHFANARATYDIPVVQEGDPLPVPGRHYVSWMPYPC